MAGDGELWKPEDERVDLDHVAMIQPGAAVDLVPVEIGAVGAARVLQMVFAPRAYDLRVPPRNGIVAQHDIAFPACVR